MTTLVTRAQWGARAAIPGGNRFGAILGTAVHWEASAPPVNHTDCALAVRQVQTFHMGPSRGWNDIAYNLVACNHDYLFEGRVGGTAANGTNYGNDHFPSVCWLGGPGHKPAAGALLAIVSARGRLGGATKPIYPHSHFFPTACPGPTLTAWVKAGAHPPGKPNPPPPLKHFSVSYADAQGKQHTDWHYASELEAFARNVAAHHAKDPGPYPIILTFDPTGHA